MAALFFQIICYFGELGKGGLPPSQRYDAPGEVFDDLKLVRCPRSLDSTLVTLP
jgi:hypothetical protein